MVFRSASIAGTDYPHSKQAQNIRMAKEEAEHVKLKVKLGSELSDEVDQLGEAHRKPKGHQRKVLEANAHELIEEEKATSIDDLETKVLPDEDLLRVLTSFDTTDEKVRDFFLCLSCCNSVVISVEQRRKGVRNVPQTPTGTRTPIDLIVNTMSKISASIRTSVQRRSKKPEKPVTIVSTFKVNHSRSNGKILTIPDGAAVSPEIYENIAYDTSPIKPIEKPNRPTTLDLNNATIKAVTFNEVEKGGFLSPGEVIYESESPDEAALVYAAKAYGVTLMQRAARNAVISWPKQRHSLDSEYMKVRYIAVLPFDSTRKMMSVLVENQTPNTGSMLLVKGADSAVLNRLDKTATLRTETAAHVDGYARGGLRTLCLARRHFDQEETIRLCERIRETESLGTEEELNQLYAEIESNLELLGATAIEDRLQDGVAESIAQLRAAQLAVWVLTGDKVQTALEIGRSCNLIKQTDELVMLTDSDTTELLEKVDRLSKDLIQTAPPAEKGFIAWIKKMLSNTTPSPNEPSSQRQTVICISGTNLEWILQHHRVQFISLCAKCNAVLCCRTTPKLKGDVVLACARILGCRTLSIGDGANDVAMIQAANIGVGISGHEGRQAVMASDYAMPRFRFLPRLLFVHGHWNYARLAQMIKYFYYKNAIFILLIFWYQIFSCFSGSNMIADMYLILFMLLFNSVPPMVNATLDQFLPRSAPNRSDTPINIFCPVILKSEFMSCFSIGFTFDRQYSTSSVKTVV